MQAALKEKHKVSSHIKDLGRMDIAKLVEVTEWLENNAVKQRDIDRRVVSKRMVNRLIAARLGLKAIQGDVPAAKEWIDRGEGKVADKIQIDQRSISLHIDLTPDRHNTDTSPLQLVDNTGAIDVTLDTESSAPALIGAGSQAVDPIPSTHESYSQTGVGAIEVPGSTLSESPSEVKNESD